MTFDHKGRATADEVWLEVMIEGLERGRDGVPSGPSPEVQRRFVGFAGADALRECFPFVQVAKRLYTGNLAKTNVLDFGVGWGRVIRLFAKDVPEAHLHGCDVDPEILAVCAETGVPGDLRLTYPGAPLPYADGTFGLAYAYSVFSHLSEAASLGALRELARVLEPGGQLTLTTQGMRFLDLCCAIREKAAVEPLTDAEATIEEFFADPHAGRDTYLAGDYCYTGIGGGGSTLTDDFYGWAAIPEKWFGEHVPELEIVERVDDPSVLEQVIFTMRRR